MTFIMPKLIIFLMYFSKLQVQLSTLFFTSGYFIYIVVSNGTIHAFLPVVNTIFSKCHKLLSHIIYQ